MKRKTEKIGRKMNSTKLIKKKTDLKWNS